MCVNKGGVRMIAAKGATCGDLSTSLSARSSNIDQEADESIFSDARNDGDDYVCLINFIRLVEFHNETTVWLVLLYVPIVSRMAAERG